MAYEFKKISNVEVVAEPTDSANVLIEENGVIKKAPKTAVGGAGGDSTFVIHGTPGEGNVPMMSYTVMNIDRTFDEIVVAINEGKRVVLDFDYYEEAHYIAQLTYYRLDDSFNPVAVFNVNRVYAGMLTAFEANIDRNGNFGFTIEEYEISEHKQN